MKITISTAFLFAAGIIGIEGLKLVSERPLCKYEKLSVTPWHNCNDYNGGKDPYTDADCDMPCARAGRKEGGKFVHVSNYWGNDACALQCYLR